MLSALSQEFKHLFRDFPSSHTLAVPALLSPLQLVLIYSSPIGWLVLPLSVAAVL
jgi:hypothetical protein